MRFHDLRHTFATMAISNGVDVKTLSTIIGHVSSVTTLDIYPQVTDLIQQQATKEIDRQIGKTDVPVPTEEEKTRVQPSNFQPTPFKRRKSGIDGLFQINAISYVIQTTLTSCSYASIGTVIRTMTSDFRSAGGRTMTQ